MQFLLLLSALLSAFTGAIGMSRDAESRARQTETQLVAAAPAERPVRAAAVQFVEPDTSPTPDAAVRPPLAAAPVRAVPLDLVRLIE